MNNFSSYGENSGFSAVPAEELELVNGGKGESEGGDTSRSDFPGDNMPIYTVPGDTMPVYDGIYGQGTPQPQTASSGGGSSGGGGK